MGGKVYLTGENNQLLSDGTYNYEYDNEGNRIRRTEIATGEPNK
jgi:YD repeat-containing protein